MRYSRLIARPASDKEAEEPPVALGPPRKNHRQFSTIRVNLDLQLLALIDACRGEETRSKYIEGFLASRLPLQIKGEELAG